MDFGNLKIFLDNWAEEFTPGCQIVIYKDNKKVYSYNTGFYDVESNIKLKGNELFNLYSCSKVATVTAALQFYEKGVFLLDDPLYDFIPEYKALFNMYIVLNILDVLLGGNITHIFVTDGNFT